MAMLRYLHPDNAMLLFYLVLTEHKVLIHSLRPALMTSIAEAITTVSRFKMVTSSQGVIQTVFVKYPKWNTLFS